MACVTLVKARRAVSLGVSALIVIVIILITGFGLFLDATFNTSTASSTLSLTSSSSTLNNAPSSLQTTSTITITATSSSSASSTTTSSNSFTQTFGTVNSTIGLQLQLSVNSTTIPSEDAIGVSVSILNTLSTKNNLTASNDWAIQGLSSGSCDLGNSTNKLFSPAGIAVFRGSYGANNLSTASPLPIWALIECPVDLAFNGTSIIGQLHNITSYSLLPMSASGNYAGYYVIPTTASSTCGGSVCTYYATPDTFAKGVFSTQMSFPTTVYANNSTGGLRPYNSLLSSLPGNYTLVAGDEWGQVVLLHFQVTSSNNLPTVGSFLASSGACDENGNPVPCSTSEYSQAFIFNCVASAATSFGCTEQVSSGLGDPGSPLTYYSITVWYPYVNQPNEPASANCMFSVKDYTSSPYGNCFLVNSTAFAMSYPV